MGDALVRAVDVRAAVGSWLLAERLPEWDLALVVVSELHSALEGLWHGVDPSHPLHALPSAGPARDGVERSTRRSTGWSARSVRARPTRTRCSSRCTAWGPTTPTCRRCCCCRSSSIARSDRRADTSRGRNGEASPDGVPRLGPSARTGRARWPASPPRDPKGAPAPAARLAKAPRKEAPAAAGAGAPRAASRSAGCPRPATGSPGAAWMRSRCRPSTTAASAST